jgi:hypothetical protein
MTTIEDSPIVTKQPSEELLKLIEDLKVNLVKTKDLFVIIVTKARDEGFEDKEIDMLLYSKLKEIIPKTTLLRYRKEFIPLGVTKRSSNVPNDTSMNDLEQSSITSGPLGPTDNKIPTLPDEINQGYQNESLTNITINDEESYKNIPNVSNETLNKDLQEKGENVVNIKTSQSEMQYTEPKPTTPIVEKSLDTTPIVILKSSSIRKIQEGGYIPQEVSDSLEIGLDQIDLSKVEKWRYESDEAFAERVDYLEYWLDSFGQEQFEWFSNLPKEERDIEKRFKLNSMYHEQYFDKLEQFFHVWKAMKKLYVELIELYCKDNSNVRIWLSDIVLDIQENLRENYNFSFPDALSKYVSQHFIDKKTKEYLIRKYGNELNHNLGFEEWKRDLKMSPKERQWEKQRLIEESRDKTKKYWEEQLIKEDKESESTGMEDLT